jgi:hypothetical protein
MKVVIKLNRRSIACIATGILFSSCLILAHQPITAVINVTNNQVLYSSVRARQYKIFNDFSLVRNSEDSFGINYNAPGNVLKALQFSVPDFNSTNTIPLSTFVKIKRSANPLWIMQEKNLLKQAFC